MTQRKELTWHPFRICDDNVRPRPSRPMATPEGRGDRLRSAAFAELQAARAFSWAAEQFTDVPATMRDAWQGLAHEEERHLGWLLQRMADLGVDPAEREVSLRLWRALQKCTSGQDFARRIASAEERGRLAGELFRAEMARYDTISAEVFGKIADEEVGHVALTRRFFPDVVIR
jgi:uncharacterized ferritin-like protein (DUF455 family)